MPHQSDAIVQHLRSAALRMRTLDLQESRSIDAVANSLRDLLASEGDLRSWLDREEHLERTAEHAAALLSHRMDDAGRGLAGVIREIVPVLRGTRAVTLRQRFPGLSEKLIAAPAGQLPESITPGTRSQK